MVHNIRITFGAQMQPQIVIQQGDYNSRTIQALCYTSSGGAMSFDGQTVSVVYSISGTVSAEYPVQVTGNVLSFTMPGLASASVGAGSMQVRIYGSESLLQSAIIPYVVKASLDPAPAEEDQVPMLVMLVQQAQQAIAGANAAASTANQVAQIANTAANLASEKAGLAQNAASSANEAATNATNSAELAQTAADNANSASESANSAAGTANNAADNANSAAESANNAATNANQVADEIQQKADSGAFNGKDGLNAPQIDDAQITATNPWSSMQIVNTLCPPFTASGSVVQCTPVANYPLGVTASWEPTQEGTGDPSPENIRPIVGLDSVQVTRCGASLFDFYSLLPETATLNGITADKLPDGRIHVHGTNTNDDFTNVVHVYIPIGQRPKFPAGTYSVGSKFNIGTNLGNMIGSFYAAEQMTISYFYIAVGSNATVDFYAMPMLVAGDVPSPAYEPYTGTTATLTLPETIYGGTVDAVTGEGSNEWGFVEFDGSEDEQWRKNVHSSGRVYFFIDITPYGLVLDAEQVTWKCNRLVPVIYNYSETGLPEYSIGFTSNKTTCAIVLENKSTLSVDEFKVWLSENPVIVCYKLAEISTYTVAHQSLPALPGTNTIFADSGDITVTGASDPIATITALQDRVSALESAQTNM